MGTPCKCEKNIFHIEKSYCFYKDHVVSSFIWESWILGLIHALLILLIVTVVSSQHLEKVYLINNYLPK